MHRHTPASDHPHVTEGICACEVYVAGVRHAGLAAVGRRVPSLRCGLSAHRVEAARAADSLRRAARGD